MEYEIVLGLEVHVELSTESKIFCSCSAKFGGDPNEHVCPACSGMPGMLPVTNQKVVELGITAGLLTNCHINRRNTFDKKNYYYPDLPAAYQITQFYAPICVDGGVEIETSKGKKVIGIKQIHMEEDAGKLVHDMWTDSSLVDFNRTSVPLCEIVSNPDFRSVEEVVAYLERIRTLLRFGRVSDCRMEEGSMRADINISVRPVGETKLGVRTEMKNMNSISAITRAIEYEAARHIDAIERGTEELVQETRRWDDILGQSFSMRDKETAADYRYFPNPDIAPIIISDEWIEKICESLPELPEIKRERYIEEFDLPEYDADLITQSRTLCDLFEDTIAAGAAPRDVSGFILGECMNALNRDGKTADDLVFAPEKLARIIALVSSEELTRQNARKVFTAVYNEDVDVDKYCSENSLLTIFDDGIVKAVVLEVIEKNPKIVADYKGGKVKAFDALFGQVMRVLRGTGNPTLIRELLNEELAK
ncbi:MAG: Asp-tRNA(Asn)/Glu-tRNA(Gln) amidotransferase subunit GatB [Clostridiales bacterium]|jgi:aspartyl-tRNA(Asn)/glutamyl-tRNA(Gln) amidotransferase subunit B|nr:Asp-tRNA(Asn)/Glu-tRNA(Gln) amidotransferase subunit GatB [Clostridiales bacterium]